MSQSSSSVAQCKICGKNSTHLCDLPSVNSKVLHIHRCDNCGFVFVGNSITFEELGAAYGSQDTTQYYKEVGETTARKFKTALKNFQQLKIDKNAAIIDIGTGHGDFLLFLRKSGFANLTGHEIPGEETKDLDNAKILVYKDFDYNSIPSSSFDVVTLMDVMEHVPDPRAVVAAIHRILKPGATIYFHTPCVTFVDRFMHRLQKLPGLGKIGRTWQRGRTSIFHLQNYTPASIEMLLRQGGFENICIEQVNELSWPVPRYVRVYLFPKAKARVFLSYLFTPFFYLFLATPLFNANKGIAFAQKQST